MEDSSDAEMSPFFAATGVAWKARCEHTSTRNVRIARAMDSPCCSPFVSSRLWLLIPNPPPTLLQGGGPEPELPRVLPPLGHLVNPFPAREPSPAPPAASAGPPAPRARSPAEWTDFGAVARPNG